MNINGFNAKTQRTQSNAEMNFSLRPAADGAQRSARPTLQPLGAAKQTGDGSTFPPSVAELLRRTGNPQPSRACGIGNPNSELPSFAQRLRRAGRTPNSQNGVALIITLILLSVVTFMAITFLALSRRERSAVSTVTDTASARLAADAALANAEAQVIANVLSTTNPYNFILLVSTNYINANGFVPGSANPTNVNYQYATGNSLNQNDFLQNLANLLYSPRPPVFIPNPTNSSLPPDFRFYLDLNRNGQFDTNGFVLETNFLGQAGINFEVGDPEWIGVLQRPDAPHGPNNPFIARYAFIAVPVGNTLDLNAIYNDATRPDLIMSPGHDGFLRNQGIGSWEINLAAFLTDLDPNQWDPSGNPYLYATWNGTLYNSGAGFEDALSLLKYRYNGTYNNLAWVQNLYSPLGQSTFQNNIDAYSDGPLMKTPVGINENGHRVDLPWAGADNINHFFTPEELFNSNEISAPFVNRLLAAGNTNSIYEHYTFYRLLSQLGTDSTPESGKMNLNYDNLVQTNANGVVSETNFYSWTAINFFTNAADRLLRAYTTQWRNSNPTNFAITFYASYAFTNINFNASQWTNYPAFGLSGAPGVIPGIPVLVSNQFVYSSAVNRLLQLAANIYDATTNSFYPSVFRPIFEHDNFGNVFIVGYTSLYSSYGLNTVLGTGDPQLATPHDVTQLFGLAATNTPITDAYGYVNVYGVPWIIGAKKGFPNFNEFVLENVVGITRRLQFTRNTNTSPPTMTGTNQMYLMNVSSTLGVDLWNSYAAQYNGTVSGWVRENLSMSLTNSDSINWPPLWPMVLSTNCPISPNPWSGLSFVIPLGNTFIMLTNSVYRSPYAGAGAVPTGYGFTPPCLIPTNSFGAVTMVYETNTPGFPLPNWGLLTTNQLQVFMLDQSANGIYHVIDYAHFEQISSRNLNAEIFTDDTAGVWNTNIDSNTGLPYGIENQINISRGILVPPGPPPSEDGLWNPDPQASPGTPTVQQASFQAFFQPLGTIATVYSWGANAQASASNYLSSAQDPYSPIRYVVGTTVLEANDPLVHYLASDLNATNFFNQTYQYNNSYSQVPTLTSLNLGGQNRRYQPWGMSASSKVALPVDPNPNNLSYKDPLVRSSDNWDFPANKFPTVGWLGRVHRGTPWQTVYLKATNILNWAEINPPYANGFNTWDVWAYGTTNLNPIAAANAAPAQDRLLFDLFTTAFNDNATRGTLSVNQNHLAAWSALFSGVVALSNNAADGSIISVKPQYQNPPPSNSWMIIQPAGPAWTNSPLGQLVNGINQTRANTNLFPLQTFAHVGDILATPQFTEQSPFLRIITNGVVDGLQQANGISDEMYEWLPQQMMSLLRVSGSPRYVIYCYGQALKPAPNGIYTGSDHNGAYFGMVTNYQVVSEIATRAVVRFGSTLTNVITTNTFLGINGWVSVPVVTNNNAVIESFNILPPD
jgi:hypothetical protein